MTIRKNILANYLGTGGVALAPILAMPWYLALLGPERFGLIGFVIMLQALLGLVDAGMSQALVREFAIRLGAENGERSAAKLLFGFERIYWLFAAGAGCITFLLANVIATHWLNLKDLPVTTGSDAIYGAAIIFAVQFPGSVYRSLLVAAQAQVTLNSVVIGSTLLRHAGGVLVVLVWPTLQTYLVWQALIALFETLARGKFAWSALNIKRNRVAWETSSLRQAWKSVASMSGATWLGALTVQTDKIFLSRMVPIEQFGYYVIASTVAMGALQLIYPLVQAVLPRAIQLRNERVALRNLLIKLTRGIGLLVVLGVLIFATAGGWLLSMWLRSASAVESVYPLLRVLLVGAGMNAFYNVGYIYWMVNEEFRRILLVNGLSLILSVALIPLFIASQGTIGAAFGWLTINLIGLVVSLEWLRKKGHNESSC